MLRIGFGRPSTGTILGGLALVVAVFAAFTALSHDSAAGVTGGGDGQTAFKRNIRYVEKDFTLQDGGVKVFDAECPAGFKVISGGHFINRPFHTVPHSYPNRLRDTWVLAIANPIGLPQVEAEGTVFAVCAKKGLPVVP
jgi:hypothetical protein